jgi:hypothetical protein
MDCRRGEHAPNIATNRTVLQLSGEALGRIADDGIPSRGMPYFRALGAANIKALVDYLWVLQGKRSSPIASGITIRGKPFSLERPAAQAVTWLRGKAAFGRGSFFLFLHSFTPRNP